MIVRGDCIEEMHKLPAGSFRAAVTSPPYNLKSTTGAKTKSLWKRSPLMDGGYTGYDDSMPHADYVEWQRACLTEMMRLIDDRGAIFYNHHWRVQDGLMVGRQDIIEGFPLRQIIIWKRKAGINFNPGYFLPNYEIIYMIAKPDFKLAPGANAWGAVWEIRPAIGNPHPAPFPVELARRCIAAVGEGPILDPFMGSGTTGVAAKMLGVEFTGIEQSEEYCEMARERINRPTTMSIQLGDEMTGDLL